MTDDEKYMRRALQLARDGLGNVSPNPMVGAVIVCDGRIIGEGYHRQYGGPHAEVNAIASVSDDDRPLLRRSTIYVTLEPCSHFGKTPPCADLIVATGLARVVVGSLDPFEKVRGRGIAKLRDAGIEVTTGVLADECAWLNKTFMTAHTLHRPYVTLKWAQSSDGFLARRDGAGLAPVRFSTAASASLVQAMRARNDAILVGSSTVIADRPRLSLRGFAGRQPLKIVLDRRGRCDASQLAGLGDRLLYLSSVAPAQPIDGEWVKVATDIDPAAVLELLYSRGITSLIVEGGAAVLRSFLDSGLWDEARVEISPMRLGDAGAVLMTLPGIAPVNAEHIDGNLILTYQVKR